MEYLGISFFAGMLTVLAPCILPFLPVIIGGSLTEKSAKRPLIITASLAVSIVAFTILLKATTLLITIPDYFWKYLSGGLILIFAISLINPVFWAKLFHAIFPKGDSKLQGSVQNLAQENTTTSAILLGAALGPIFASCSPTYFLILGTVLPSSFITGLIYLLAYAIGLSITMFMVAFSGQKVMAKLKIVANSNGKFKQILGYLFLIIAIGIITGYDKKIETKILDSGFFSVTQVEQNILDSIEGKKEEDKGLLNKSYLAPEFEGLENWINHSEIASIEDLRGKVVLIDFWTYSCINCIRTLPHIQQLHEKYTDDGLVIIGIHAPEFAFEQKFKNVQNAVDEYELTYPVVQDNDFKTWRNFNNKYWPAKYLIDKDGYVRYTHFGEGDHEETEKAIQLLLDADANIKSVDSTVDFTQIETRETYLGTDRRTDNYVKEYNKDLDLNQWSITDEWEEDAEKIFSSSLPVKLKMVTHASSINLVLGGDATVSIFIDGVVYKDLIVDEPKLYNLFYKEGEYKEREIELNFEGKNIEAYAWTFG